MADGRLITAPRNSVRSWRGASAGMFQGMRQEIVTLDMNEVNA